jgi:hypothetical protein
MELDYYLAAMRAQAQRLTNTINALCECDMHGGQVDSNTINLMRTLRAQLDGITNNGVKYADNFSGPERQQALTAMGWPEHCKWPHGDLMFEV